MFGFHVREARAAILYVFERMRSTVPEGFIIQGSGSWTIHSTPRASHVGEVAVQLRQRQQSADASAKAAHLASI
jgi:hypothetical protein